MERLQEEHEGEEETSNKPADSPYDQQAMRAWSPLLTPWRAASGYLLIGLIFVPLGAVLWQDADDTVEMRFQYDGDGSDGNQCEISTYKEGKSCNVSFEVAEDMAGPVYVYYELDNFYQNHATYVVSVDDDQLQGSLTTSSSCSPLQYSGTAKLHPCGVIANSLFNDVFDISSGQTMDETDIAWNSDVAEKFSQPDGFVSSACDGNVTCAECLAAADLTDSEGGTTFADCGNYTDANGEEYAYYYPEEDEYQYLYETFPEVISPLDGVMDEHFIVWMRISGLSKFRKLYGRIEDGLSAGDTITFNITANYVVTFFDGTKSIVISTTGSLGGRNPYWGQSMPAIGAVALLLALVLALKFKFSPREMGDITKLLDST